MVATLELHAFELLMGTSKNQLRWLFEVPYGTLSMALFALNVERLSWICHTVSGTAKSL